MENSFKGIKREVLIGLPVIEKGTGRLLGSIEDFYMSGDKSLVEGMYVMGSGWLKKRSMIPFENVGTIGIHAVITQDKAHISDSDPKNKLGCEVSSIIGLRVITVDGIELGIVSDIIIDPVTGRIESMELSEGFFDDLITGRCVMPFSHEKLNGGDVIIATKEQAAQLSSYQKGIKNMFLNKLNI